MATFTWSFVDGTGANGINLNTAKIAGRPKTAVFNSKLYAVWNEESASSTGQIRAAVYNGSDSSPGWSFVDGGGANGINKDTSKVAQGPEIVAFNSKLYAVWQEAGTSNNQIRVAVYNGNDGAPSWSFVDGNGTDGLNKATAQNARFARFAVLSSKLYLCWQETNASSVTQVRVAVYNGNDSSPSWSFVDGGGANGINKDTGQNGAAPAIYVFNSKLYAGWYETASGIAQIRVAVYNGNDSSPSWSFVDGNASTGINKDVTHQAQTPQFAILNSKLYAVWREQDASAIYQVRVAVYGGNDSSPSWSIVDGNGAEGLNYDTSKVANSPIISVVGSAIYVTWVEANGSSVNQVRVSAFNGNDSSPTWSRSDGGGASGINKSSASTASVPQLTVLSSKPYLVWAEGSTGQIVVALGTP